MQAMMRDPILNKTSNLTTNPRLRHLLGQRDSTFSLVRAIDSGCCILLHLDKQVLGPEANTIGALFLSWLKNAIFARQKRELFTLDVDEFQNVAGLDTGVDTLLSESRKWGVSICAAHQHLEQVSAAMRAALHAVGTHI